MPGYPFGMIKHQRDSAREYVDAAGTGWRVYELPAVGTDDALRRPCLVFENHAAVRRVHDYPSNWRTLTEAELTALSWRA